MINYKKWILISSTVTFVLLIIFIFIIPLTYFRNDSSNLGNYYSAIQAFVDILLLPIVLFGFVFSIFEYRKNLYAPKLKLLWESHDSYNDQSHTIIFKKDEDIIGYGASPYSLLLRNNGNAIASIYCIKLDLTPILPNVVVYSSINNNYLQYSCDYRNDSMSWDIHNIDFPPIYPNYSADFLRINFPAINIPLTIKDTYSIDYKIYTDNSEVVEGTLFFRIVDNKSN